MSNPTDEDIDKLIDNLDPIDIIQICGVNSTQKNVLRAKLKILNISDFENYTKHFTGAKTLK